MVADTWAALVSGIVVPLVLRVIVHRWPWLADDARPDDVARDVADVAPDDGPSS